MLCINSVIHDRALLTGCIKVIFFFNSNDTYQFNNYHEQWVASLSLWLLVAAVGLVLPNWWIRMCPIHEEILVHVHVSWTFAKVLTRTSASMDEAERVGKTSEPNEWAERRHQRNTSKLKCTTSCRPGAAYMWFNTRVLWDVLAVTNRVCLRGRQGICGA